MCGIAGFVQTSGTSHAAEHTLKAMLDALAHRGPDGEGMAVLAPAFLGHRRLSILDVEGGAQPMATPDGRYTVTYNGEIYNFRELRQELEKDGVVLHTHCDTEVLPYLFQKYGSAMLERLNGMYAFAIWDKLEQRLFMARDKMGIKPLFYWNRGEQLVFASELGALLRHPSVSRELDSDSLSMYFTLNYIPDPWTAFSGVYKLPPGHCLWFKGGRLEIEQYWDLETIIPEPPMPTEAEALIQLDRELRRSVGMQMVSDVPLGAFLSGGIDSGLVVSYMAELSDRPVKTFSIGFDEQGYNELPLARQVAQRYRTEHHELLVRPDTVALLNDLVSHFAEPFGDPSCIPTYLVSKLAREHVTVCLSGDGGDELFAGYTKYLRIAAVERVSRLPRPLLTLGAKLSATVDLELFRRTRRLLNRAALPFADSFLEGACYLDEAWADSPSELAGRLRQGKQKARDMYRQFYRGEHPIRAAQYMDMKTYLPGDILTKVDRTSMAVSLESRVPLLDDGLVKWANNLPVGLKQKNGEGKYLLRRLAAERLSREHVEAPKRGFGIPLQSWLRGPLREMVYDTLLGSAAEHSPWLDRAQTEIMVKRHMDGVQDYSGQIWSLLFFENWRSSLSQPPKRRDV